ncbi:MAG TPA: PBP1A family penicillin-binding protein [Vicinamibacterales bacterium]|nr:PBP1A family penicillin-binding protein [Vicinamibacterales bacterium]
MRPGLRLWEYLVIVPVLTALLVLTILGTWWAGRHGWAIDRLTRGVGDTVFYTADGSPWFPMDEQRRDVSIDQISPNLRNAVIAVEDHRFRYHPGIDPIGFSRAVVENLRARGVTEGGSTISQQLARTLFLSNVRTWGRKAQEGALAVMLEIRLTKEQILELYLNRVYLGAGAYGVEKMSQHLFGKSASDLTIAEGALIAGLIQRPSALSPWSNMAGARERSHVVLQRMREEGYITDEEEKAARAGPLRIRPYPRSDRADNGYAKQYVRQQFRNAFGGDHPPDWKVFTTFNASLQAEAERAITRGLARLGRKDLQAALVALRPATGEIVALVGGRDFTRSEFDRATRSRRQPGSAFKPFVYAAALERGYTPVTLLTQPEQIPVKGVGDWRPRNVSRSSLEPIPLREAFIESNNRTAVGVQQAIGSRPIRTLGAELGLADLPDVASLALGTGAVSPLQLTTAYAAFPNGGYAVRPKGIVSVIDAQGAEAWELDDRKPRVMSEQTAYQMVSLMRDVIDRGTGAAARARGVNFPAGGKTGTTNDGHDAWFVGFTSSLVVGVWVGLDQPAPLPNASGARYALPIWADFMTRAARVLPARGFTPPASLHQQDLCSVSYLRPTEHCPVYREYFKRDDEVPGGTCRVHRAPSIQERLRDTVRGWLDRLKGIFR